MRSLLAVLGLLMVTAAALAAEYNPVVTHGGAADEGTERIIVGFRVTAANQQVQLVRPQLGRPSVRLVQARTSAADVAGLAARTAVQLARSRQLTPGMHLLFLQQRLFGADIETTLAKLRADPAVKFADVDQRRFAHSLPNDPLFVATSGATGQWYLQTPNSTDLSATDAVSAWAITTGSAGTVIADIDTGVRFDHPDLLRAGFGGRLLPGYDFVGHDHNASTGVSLSTFLTANDGDGWDPDPSDPGDWIQLSDQQSPAFPSAQCAVSNSSWHGTRVMGILGAIANNGVGITGLTWSPWVLPVRALGKCGG
jgi:serine protease